MAQQVVIDIEARFIDNTSGVGAASRKLDQFSRTIDRAQSRIERLNGKKVNPQVDVNDNAFLRKMANIRKWLAQHGHTKAEAMVGVVDNATRKILSVVQRARMFVREKFTGALAMRAFGAIQTITRVRGLIMGLVGRAWRITIGVADKVTAPIRNIIGQFKGLIGMAGLAGVSGTVYKAVQNEITQQNLEAQYATMFSNDDKIIGKYAKDGTDVSKLGQKKRMKLGYKAAEDRLNELIEFAGHTPYTRQEIFQADKILQTYTGGKLNNTKDRELVGNLAALGGRDFTSVATMMGRMYVNMKGGHGIGDSTMYLREMGVLSAEAEEHISKLAEKVKSGGMTMEDAWKGVRKEFANYDGMMEEMSKKLGNLLLGIKAQITNNVLTPIGEGISDSLSPFLERFKAWRGTDQGKEVIGNFKESLKGITTTLSGGLLNGIEKLAGGFGRIYRIWGFLSRTKPDMSPFEKLGKLINLGIVRPVSDWWNNKGGKEFFMEGATKWGDKLGSNAGKIGSDILKGILSALTGEDGSIGSVAGEFAKSFVDGFKENFDLKGVLDDLWSAVKEHPIMSMVIGGTILNKGAGMLGGLMPLGGLGGGGGASGVGGLVNTIGSGMSTVNSGFTLWDNTFGKLGKKGGSMVGVSSTSAPFVAAGGRTTGQGKATLMQYLKGGTKGAKALRVLGPLAMLAGGVFAAKEFAEASSSSERKSIFGDYFGGLGGGVAGAAIGTAIMPGVGTIIGGALGGLGGGALGKAIVGGGGGNTSRWKGHGVSGERKMPTHRGGKVRQEIEVEPKVKVNRKKTSSAIDKATTKAAKTVGRKKTKANKTIEVATKGVLKNASKLRKSVEKKAKSEIGKGKTKATHKATVTVEATTKTRSAENKVKNTAKEALDNKTTNSTVKATAKVNTRAVKGSLSKAFDMQSWVTGSLPKTVSATVRVNVTRVKGSVGGYKPSGDPGYRGRIVGAGIPHYAEGGLVRGGSQLALVAEEGTPEAIIPLGKHRRKRGLELWQKAGEYLGVNKYAVGGFAGSASGGSHGGGSVRVNVGGITINVNGKSAEDGVSTNKERIAQEIAGVLEAALSSQFENMPVSA